MSFEAELLERARRLGAQVAQMHVTLDTLPPERLPVHWSRHWLVDRPLDQLAPLLGGANAWPWLVDTVLAASRRGPERLPTSQPTYGLIHGDLHQDNILVRPEGMVMVDTESIGYGWRAWEMAYFSSGDFREWTWEPEIERERRRRRAAFVEGYHVVRALTEDERASQSAFGVLRLVLAMARLATLGTEDDRAPERVACWLDYLGRWIDLHVLA